MNKLTRNDIIPALLRPGMYTGPQGSRTDNEWLADAIVEYLNARDSIVEMRNHND